MRTNYVYKFGTKLTEAGYEAYKTLLGRFSTAKRQEIVTNALVEYERITSNGNRQREKQDGTARGKTRS